MYYCLYMYIFYINRHQVVKLYSTKTPRPILFQYTVLVHVFKKLRNEVYSTPTKFPNHWCASSWPLGKTNQI